MFRGYVIKKKNNYYYLNLFISNSHYCLTAKPVKLLKKLRQKNKQLLNVGRSRNIEIFIVFFKQLNWWCENEMSETLNMVKIVANLSNKTVLSSVKFILVMGQCFALLPVDGVMKSKLIYLKFKWKSWKCIYAICCLLCTNFMILMGTIYLFQFGFHLPQFGT